MTRRRRIGLAIVLAMVALGAALTVLLTSSGARRGAPPPEPPESQSPTPSQTPTATATATPSRPPVPPAAAGPPAGTKQVGSQYRDRYRGQYASWDALLAYGRPLPEADAGCRAAWQATTKDPKLNWDRAGYLCLASLTGSGFKPQGLTGSGQATGYRIADQSASHRNLVFITSYSTAAEPGLRFPNRPGRTDATRLTVIDLDQKRYNQIELVKPTSAGKLTALDSHGSGVAWAGQYLYSSNRVALYAYNVDDLLYIDGRFVLPAVARWAVSGKGGLSTLAITKSGRQTKLRSITYSKTGVSWTHSFRLGKSGEIQPGPNASTVGALQLTRDFGPMPKIVRNQAASTLPGTNFQGLSFRGDYRLVNSSSIQPSGKAEGDYLLIFRGNRLVSTFLMPKENLEGSYADLRRNRYLAITEHGQQFLFWFPLDYLIKRANTS